MSDDNDLRKAQARLEYLKAPNTSQWVVELTSRYIAQGRNETDIRSLAELARALGVDTAQMAPYLGTPAPYPLQESSP